MSTRHFSLEEARALIPQIRPHLRAALQLHASLRPVIHRINDAGYDVDWEMLAGEVELDDEARERDIHDLSRARALYACLRAEVDAVEATGGEVRGVVQGIVEFRSFRDGLEEVLLCWRLGEPTVMFHHELQGDCEQRRGVDGHSFTAQRAPAILRSE